MDAANALAFASEGLAAPIHIVDNVQNFNGSLDALAALGGQLLSVQDTSGYNPFPWAISVADVLALAPQDDRLARQQLRPRLRQAGRSPELKVYCLDIQLPDPF